MSSDDEVLPNLPQSQCAQRSKKTVPVTSDGSKSDPDDAEEVEKKVDSSYARPRIMWDRFTKVDGR